MSRSLPKTATVRVVVPAQPEQVWAVLSDPTRVGEWSHEACQAEWLPPATEARVGARFAGGNAIGKQRWTRHVEIETCDPPVELAWRTIRRGLYRDSTTWTFRLRPVDGGATEVEQSFVLSGSALLLRALWWMVPSHRDRTEALAADLRRLGEVASAV